MLAVTCQHPYATINKIPQPTLRHVGEDINPKNNGTQRAAETYPVSLKRIGDGSEIKVMVPPQANISNVHFSPDSTRLSFLNRKDDRIELWIADTATGRARLLSGLDRLNATTGDPCDWLRDNKTLICQLVPAGRGPAPAESTVPVG